MLQELETHVSKGFLSGATHKDLYSAHPSKREARMRRIRGTRRGLMRLGLHPESEAPRPTPAGVALGWWVLVVLVVPASEEPVSQQVSPRGRTKKGSRRGPAWSLPPTGGLYAETGTPGGWGSRKPRGEGRSALALSPSNYGYPLRN